MRGQVVSSARDPPEGCAGAGEAVCPLPAHLADEGGIGEGWPDVGVLVELVILGQLWGRQAEDEAAAGGPSLGKTPLPSALT